jgi:hypothetical protein
MVGRSSNGEKNHDRRTAASVRRDPTKVHLHTRQTNALLRR